jgi:predicted metal-dependent phosphoesterase TrpH
MEAALLCELHAHSTWSDGALELEQVVDLYGRRGFDVLCITDHVVRGDGMLTAERHPAYLAAIRAEAERAAARYGMLVIPGLELTYDDPADSTRSAHAVAVGLEQFVSLDGGIAAAMEEARAAGAALIAAHPHGAAPDTIPGRTTRRFWRDAELRSLVHRFELINRHRVFAWSPRRDCQPSPTATSTCPSTSTRGKRSCRARARRRRWSTSCVPRLRPR